MWAHRAWQGRFLPKGLGRGEALSAYATWCTAVEGNTTFYGLPSADAVVTWADAAPGGWQPWVAVVADWLREGRTPTFFLHTPDNDEALGLARRFHDEVRSILPELRPLPEPLTAGDPQEPSAQGSRAAQGPAATLF